MRASARVLLSPLLALLFVACGTADTSKRDVPTAPTRMQSEPTFLEDNPSCESLGLTATAYKVEPPDSGTYSLDAYNQVTVVVDGLTFTWSATLPIDAVIVKGGPNALLYTYEPEALTGDGALHAPVNPTNGLYYGLSHIEFCFDYEVMVSKTAIPSFDRTFAWSIDKTSATTALTLSDGQVMNVDYAVDLAATFLDSNFAVSGEVVVTNPAPMDATVTGITDLLGTTPVTLTCPVTFPHVLAPTATLTCTYSVPVASATNVMNYATATTTGAVGGGSASDLADFATEAVMTEIDECLTVTDDRFGPLGTFCEPGPHHVPYTLALGPFECGEHSYVNVASFVTNDLGATGSSSWTVVVTVPCPEGCTLTPGYWKTHSTYGPAPYDDTWALLGEDTMFFLSGKSYYQALWVPPAGNAYWTLARAYIAAKLNHLDGAGFTAAQTAFDQATALLALYTPAAIDGFRGKLGNEIRGQVISLAGTLDAYNNGLIGPGHCDE